MTPSSFPFARLVWLFSLLLLGMFALNACDTDASQLAGASVAPQEQVSAQVQPTTPPQATQAADQVQAAAQTQTAAVAAQLQLQSDGALQIDYNAPTGVARWVATDGSALTREFARQNLGAEGAARAFLGAYGRLFGVVNQGNEMQLAQVERDEFNQQHVHFRQQQAGIDVFGADLNVHLDSEGTVQLVNGYTLPDARNISLAPTLRPEAAAQAAVTATGLGDGIATQTKLVILNAGLLTEQPSPTYLTYQIRVDSATQPAAAVWLFIDATTGEVRFGYPAVTEGRTRNTHNLQHGTNIAGALVARNETAGPVTTAPDCTINDINLAHEYAGQAYDFYLNRFGRDSYNNAGAALNSYVCYSRNYQNAYWDGSSMVYGDGFVLDDVVGHELSHAVTEYISGLIYSGQSGALNESFSDIMGEALDLTNTSGNDTAGVRWDMGEELPGIGAIRDMMDPARFGNPDRTDSSSYDCGNGSVHTNSGVQNKAFALMVDGGTFNGYTIAPVGMDKALQIIYRAHDLYLTSAAKFLDAYNAINRSCSELYGGAAAAECTSVKNALDATKMAGPVCGVGGAPLPTPTPIPTDATAWLKWLDGMASLTPQDYADFCLNLHNNNGADGAVVNLWRCDSHDAKKWQYYPDGTIRPKNYPNACLNLHNNAGVDGATINLWTCNGQPAQKWNADAAHNLHPQDYPGFCLNLHNNAGVDGATINLWTCNGQRAQKWNVLRFDAKPLVNGNFEAGRNVGWTETDTKNEQIVSRGDAQTGNWKAWLAGVDGTISTIVQSVKVPATGGTLTYAYKIISSDSCGYDFGYVEANGAILKSYNLCRTNTTNGYVAGSVSLAAYAGQTLTIRFRATTDSSIPSSFYLDNIIMNAGALAETPDPHASSGETAPEAKPVTTETQGESKGGSWQLFLPFITN